MRLPFGDLLRIFLEGKGTWYFLGFAIFALSTSMAIVLSNIGLMDGYDSSLKKVLRAGQGDISLYSQQGFFTLQDLPTKFLEKNKAVQAVVGVIQSEAFVVRDEVARGVMIKAIHPGDVAYFHLRPWKPGSVVVGRDLAKELKLSSGSSLSLTFAQGNASDSDLPSTSFYKTDQFYHTGLYQYDSRVIYMYIEDYRKVQQLGPDRINKVHLFLRGKAARTSQSIEKYVRELGSELPHEFAIRPYWSDYATLFEAVQVEKKSISLVLQLIIIMSLFNIVSFVYYLTDKKGTEFFTLRALGLSSKSLLRFLLGMVVLFWAVSCAGSLLFVGIVNRIILRLPWLQIPGKIYELGQLELSLSWSTIGQVFLISLGWVFLVSYWSLLRLKRKSLVAGLREEFGT